MTKTADQIKFTLYKNSKPVTLSANTLKLEFGAYLLDRCIGGQCEMLKQKPETSQEFRTLVKYFFATYLRMVQELKDFDTYCTLFYPVLLSFTETKK